MILELLMQFQCLTDTVYFEARNQSFAGQVAVAEVVLNRVESSRYPDNICEVVYQPYQFSWTLSKQEVYNHEAYSMAQIASIRALLGSSRSMGSTHYHASYVYPNWAAKSKPLVKIQDHIFYP